MGRIRSAVSTFVTGFVTAFAVVALVRDRQAGLKAGLVWGGVTAALSWFVSGKFDEREVAEELSVDVTEHDGTESAD